MYHPLPSQRDCASAWREAVRKVDSLVGKSAYNVIIDVEQPTIDATRKNPRIAVVDDFLKSYDKSVETVANTIMPMALYNRYGAPEFFDVFHKNVLAKVKKNSRWSGYYFERMTSVPSDETINPLWDIVKRIRSTQVTALNKFELAIFDPVRDVDDSPYGGQCLSFLSFKLVKGQKKTLCLTVMYRNHFYIEKLLGNLIGLGRLMSFVAQESGVEVGHLTVVSTHAKIDTPRGARRGDVTKMIERFDQIGMDVPA